MTRDEFLRKHDGCAFANETTAHEPGFCSFATDLDALVDYYITNAARAALADPAPAPAADSDAGELDPIAAMTAAENGVAAAIEAELDRDRARRGCGPDFLKTALRLRDLFSTAPWMRAMRTRAQERGDEAMKFRKKPIVVEAHRWFRNGDHPEDGADSDIEGRVVRYFRDPDINGTFVCGCGRKFRDHGFIDTLEGGHAVCPGDWIITGIKGERYPCKPDIFALTYEPATPSPETKR